MKTMASVLVMVVLLLLGCNPAQQSSPPPAGKGAPASASTNSPDALCTPPEIIHTALMQFGDMMTEKGPQALRSKIRQTPLTGRSLVVEFEDGPPMYYRQYILSFSIPELRSHDKQTGQTMCHARFTMTGLTVPNTGTSSTRITYAGMYRIFKSEGKTFLELSLDQSSKNSELIPDLYRQDNKSSSSTGEKSGTKSETP